MGEWSIDKQNSGGSKLKSGEGGSLHPLLFCLLTGHSSMKLRNFADGTLNGCVF